MVSSTYDAKYFSQRALMCDNLTMSFNTYLFANIEEHSSKPKEDRKDSIADSTCIRYMYISGIHFVCIVRNVRLFRSVVIRQRIT